jgi:hypothetical protein
MPQPAVVHFEITGNDSAVLKRFYGILFGWPMYDQPMPACTWQADAKAAFPDLVRRVVRRTAPGLPDATPGAGRHGSCMTQAAAVVG